MKKYILILLLAMIISFSACAQSLSGRYATDDEDSIYQYFEFSESTVEIGVGSMGNTTIVTASYKIECKSVIISGSNSIIKLEIVDSNTLIGVGFAVDEIKFRKTGTVLR
jgi:hypothetical protein